MPYFQNEYWRYLEGDWFDADPCRLASEAPAWYAPDLIRQIADAKVCHEIGCHTFSHAILSDGICPPEVAEAELSFCEQVAAEWGIKLQSLVFPGNLTGNLLAVKRAGIRAYRHRTSCELDWPRQDEHGLWQIPGGISLEKPSHHWSDHAWVSVLCKAMDRAIEVGAVCSFWFHPSMEQVNMRVVLPGLLEHVAVRRGDVWATTMGGLASLSQSLLAETRLPWYGVR